jgi:hypothetical protein
MPTSSPRDPLTPVLVRLPPWAVEAVDDWHHSHRMPSRTAAILSMLAAALTANKLGIVKKGELHFSTKNKKLAE